MEFLVLQGPNLNLIGLRSAQVGQRITLDKINRSLRQQAHKLGITLKFLQTHRIDKALTFIQRNRNSAQGILLAPMAWASYELALLETLQLIRLPVVQVLFDEDFDFGPSTGESIYTDFCQATVVGQPDTVFPMGCDILIHNIEKSG